MFNSFNEIIENQKKIESFHDGIYVSTIMDINEKLMDF